MFRSLLVASLSTFYSGRAWTEQVLRSTRAATTTTNSHEHLRFESKLDLNLNIGLVWATSACGALRKESFCTLCTFCFLPSSLFLLPPLLSLEVKFELQVEALRWKSGNWRKLYLARSGGESGSESAPAGQNSVGRARSSKVSSLQLEALVHYDSLFNSIPFYLHTCQFQVWLAQARQAFATFALAKQNKNINKSIKKMLLSLLAHSAV